jgi:transposase
MQSHNPIILTGIGKRMSVPEKVVDRDRLIELVRQGNTPEQIAEIFRVDGSIIRDMIHRLEQNGYYDLLHPQK